MSRFCETGTRRASGLLAASALMAMALLAVMAATVAWAPRPAYAKVDSRPSVLIVEAGLGDYGLCSLRWLGEDVQPCKTLVVQGLVGDASALSSSAKLNSAKRQTKDFISSVKNLVP